MEEKKFQIQKINKYIVCVDFRFGKKKIGVSVCCQGVDLGIGKDCICKYIFYNNK